MTRVGDYEVGNMLGAGGMGQVFAATHPDRAAVVIKLLHDALLADPVMPARLCEEARAAQLVSHKNVVRVVDHGVSDAGLPFLVMDKVDGLPLGILIQRDGPFPLARIRTIATQMLAGLAAVHRAGLVHGDIKSDNVLVDANDKVTIIDFGLSRRPHTRPDWLGEHVLSGTPEYMAPELVCGEPITAAADLYAVGVVIYEMLTGSTPFAGGTITTIFDRHMNEDVVPPSLRCPERMIPVPLETVVMRALAKDPALRHHNAEMFATVLERAIEVRWVEQRPARMPVIAPPPVASDPTHEWTSARTSRQLPHPRRRFAEGTQPRDSIAVLAKREDLRVALASHSADQLIVGYLGLAQALIDEHRLVAAARELEAAVAWLAERPEPAAQRWRLLVTLAAVYDGVGDPVRAREAAEEAMRAARQSGITAGVARANALLHRFEAAASTRSRRRRRGQW